MPGFTVKFDSPGGIDIALSNAQLQELGQVAMDSIKSRFAQGIDLNDQPAKPLSARYDRYKESVQHVSDAIRNLRLTGHTLASMEVRVEGPARVAVGFEDAESEKRVLMNQNIDPMMGLSPTDMRAVQDKANELIQSNLDSNFASFRLAQ